jgi:hypothetical protein
VDEGGKSPLVTASGVTRSALWKFDDITTLDTLCG